jgi:hypothetical protein
MTCERPRPPRPARRFARARARAGPGALRPCRSLAQMPCKLTPRLLPRSAIKSETGEDISTGACIAGVSSDALSHGTAQNNYTRAGGQNVGGLCACCGVRAGVGGQDGVLRAAKWAARGAARGMVVCACCASRQLQHLLCSSLTTSCRLPFSAAGRQLPDRQADEPREWSAPGGCVWAGARCADCHLPAQRVEGCTAPSPAMFHARQGGVSRRSPALQANAAAPGRPAACMHATLTAPTASPCSRSWLLPAAPPPSPSATTLSPRGPRPPRPPQAPRPSAPSLPPPAPARWLACLASARARARATTTTPGPAART